MLRITFYDFSNCKGASLFQNPVNPVQGKPKLLIPATPQSLIHT